LDRNLQDAALAIQQLHVALVGAEQIYGRSEDLFEPLAHIADVPKPCGRLVQPRERCGFSCELGMAARHNSLARIRFPVCAHGETKALHRSLPLPPT
jgi:hypothetical protein